MHFSLATILAVVPLLVSAAPTAQKPRVTIPISKTSNLRRADGSVNLDALRVHTTHSTAKILRGFANYERNAGKRHPLSPGVKNNKREVGNDELTDEQNQFWHGVISVGTPAVEYSVDFDTGSSDLFLPGADCDQTCDGHTKYDPSASSTSEDISKTFSLQYGDGSTVQGSQFVDTVSVAGLTAEQQTLGAANTYSEGFQSSNFNADGLMGMGFQTISEFNAPPVFQSLVSAGQTDEPVFAFKLTETGSELTVGGLNQGLYDGEITYVPVTQEGYWQVDFDALNVDGEKVVDTTSCIVDSGTTLVIGDTENVKAFYDKIPGAQDASSTIGEGFYTFPCDSALPDVSFTLGGQDFPMTETLNFGPLQEGSSDCVGSIVGDSSIGSQFWILGDSFMSNYYTVFDVGNSQVGFAKLA